MSEPIPESIPTSHDPRSRRPTKRRALTPLSEQANEIQSLFKNPDKEIRIPTVSKLRTAASLAPPPEIVANVQGSSAGAGSGEFHVYKASRRREYERTKLMEEELKREQENEEFERKREEARKKDEEKTEKNRRKRAKKKKGKEKQDKGRSEDKVTERGILSGGKSSAQENDQSGAKPNADVAGVIFHDED
ncbi:hypothetical protein FQN57_007066 [Myotisia sp. PD_48]|nr:hypothetical protein FQN57_007066 [Myotisia sp. PD_48]